MVAPIATWGVGHISGPSPSPREEHHYHKQTRVVVASTEVRHGEWLRHLNDERGVGAGAAVERTRFSQRGQHASANLLIRTHTTPPKQTQLPGGLLPIQFSNHRFCGVRCLGKSNRRLQCLATVRSQEQKKFDILELTISCFAQHKGRVWVRPPEYPKYLREGGVSVYDVQVLLLQLRHLHLQCATNFKTNNVLRQVGDKRSGIFDSTKRPGSVVSSVKASTMCHSLWTKGKAKDLPDKELHRTRGGSSASFKRTKSTPIPTLSGIRIRVPQRQTEYPS